jgi:hypothetical protein
MEGQRGMNGQPLTRNTVRAGGVRRCPRHDMYEFKQDQAHIVPHLHTVFWHHAIFTAGDLRSSARPSIGDTSCYSGRHSAGRPRRYTGTAQHAIESG